jgi:hypothetical protein
MLCQPSIARQRTQHDKTQGNVVDIAKTGNIAPTCESEWQKGALLRVKKPATRCG